MCPNWIIFRVNLWHLLTLTHVAVAGAQLAPFSRSFLTSKCPLLQGASCSGQCPGYTDGDSAQESPRSPGPRPHILRHPLNIRLSYPRKCSERWKNILVLSILLMNLFESYIILKGLIGTWIV